MDRLLKFQIDIESVDDFGYSRVPKSIDMNLSLYARTYEDFIENIKPLFEYLDKHIKSLDEGDTKVTGNIDLEFK